MKRIIYIDEQLFDMLRKSEYLSSSDERYLIRAVANSRPYEDKWIPVKERLPEEDGEYEVTRAEYIPSKPDYHTFDTEGGSYWGLVVDIAKFETRRINDYNNGFDKAYKVIAWRPLPEVYMGDF